MLKKLFLSCAVGLMVLPMMLHAQGTDSVIVYDQEVTDDITDDEFFDWWRLDAQAGDVIVVFMTGFDGLAPLVGLLDPTRNIVARSDQPAEDMITPSEPNGRATLEYVAETSGEYIINASRMGIAEGETTGTYHLTVRRANSASSTGNSLQAVEFRCGTTLVTTVATLEFSQQAQQNIRVSMYALDGFEPYIRVVMDDAEVFDECTSDSEAMGGDQYTLPDDGTVLLAGDAPETAAGIGLQGGSFIRRITLTFASGEGEAGRWMVVMDGFSIAPAGDTDTMEVRIGPLAAADTELLVYMVAVGDGRLNPQVGWQAFDIEDDYYQLCNDVGRRGCEDIPEFAGYGVILSDGTEIIGDRFTAGVRLAPEDVEEMSLEFSSFAPSATGQYAIVILGELPARETD